MSDTVRTVLAGSGFLVGLLGFAAIFIGGETYNGRAQVSGAIAVLLGFGLFLAGAWNY